jgi:hypothetical protein
MDNEFSVQYLAIWVHTVHLKITGFHDFFIHWKVFDQKAEMNDPYCIF